MLISLGFVCCLALTDRHQMQLFEMKLHYTSSDILIKFSNQRHIIDTANQILNFFFLSNVSSSRSLYKRYLSPSLRLRLISLFLSNSLLTVTVLCQLLSCSFLFASFTHTPSLCPLSFCSSISSIPPLLFSLSQFNLPSCTFQFCSLLYLYLFNSSAVCPKAIMYIQGYVC